MSNTQKTPIVIAKIQSMKDKLSKSELAVCNYIADHPDEVIYLSVSDLADKSGVSPATVVRACHKIGSGSYQDIKISIAQDLTTPLEGINEDITANDSISDITEKVFQGILHTLNMTYRIQDASTLEKAADILLGANKIFICGLGNSHAVAEDIQHKFMRLGLTALSHEDTHLQIIGSTFLTEKDVLFAVSHSGSSKDICHVASVALENKAKVISLTNIGKSPLSDMATVALQTTSTETKYRRVALSSRIAQLSLVDVLYTIMAMKKPGAIDGFYQIEKGLGITKF